MASNFAAFVAQLYEPADVQEFVPGTDTNEPFGVGDLVYVDVADLMLAKRCGADPSLIAGISEGDSTIAPTLTENGRMPIRILNSRMVVAMASATTFAWTTHVGVAYGIARDASGHWLVDTADTSNTRVIVVGGDERTNTFFVKFLAASLQFDAVAS